MNTNLIRAIVRPFALAALPALLLVSCKDEVTNPLFGSGCSSGTIETGDVITGAFNAESCVIPLYFWGDNRVPYTTYRVSLQEGKGYKFHLAQMPDDELVDDVDAVLVLWGRNETGASIPLGISDDQGEGSQGLDSELYFIAPRSGSFNLVVSSYDNGYFGGWRLEMQECPVVAVLETAGTHANIPFAATECIRHDHANSGFDSPVVFVEVPAEAGETVGATVTAAGFATAAEFGGPGFDVYDYASPDDADFGIDANDPSVIPLTNGAFAGSFTLLVGASSGSPSGTFTVALTRTPAPGVGGVAAVRSGSAALKARFNAEAEKAKRRR